MKGENAGDSERVRCLRWTPVSVPGQGEAGIYGISTTTGNVQGQASNGYVLCSDCELRSSDPTN